MLLERMLTSILKLAEQKPLALLLDALPILRFIGHPSYAWIKKFWQARDEFHTLQVPVMRVTLLYPYFI